jgi:hypothetical protein
MRPRRSRHNPRSLHAVTFFAPSTFQGAYVLYPSDLLPVRCITQHVVSTSRCPVCNSSLLLYCLFKLDLPASL